ncbi:MAG: acyl carrier protein [Chitinispirillia bacterium]|jgi:acyl carrier protein
METTEVKEIIRALITEIAEDMEVDEEIINDSAHLIEDMDLDSMALLEVLASMEKKFNISIPESEFSQLTSIDRCTETVEKYLAAKV